MATATARWRCFLRVDPVPLLASCGNEAIAFFARRDLLGEDPGPVSALWALRAASRILSRQRPDGSFPYPGGQERLRSRANYDQLETFRQVGVLVEKHGLDRKHPALARAADFLFSFQTAEGDFRGIYGNQHATPYAGAILELLVKAGYARDPRVARAFRWLLSMRQDDGGWAIPVRTAGLPFPEFLDPLRHKDPVPPNRGSPSAHLVTGMVLRAFAAHPRWRRSPQARAAGRLLARSLYRRDAYSDRGDPRYWERVSFPFWFTDIVSALDTLSRLGAGAEEPALDAALGRVRRAQRADGTFGFVLLKGKDPDLPLWICLSVCRSLARLLG
ncbi:MAG TPA: hypothetical protein VFG59_10380 [Anaeromyxobacter sp.]|nr:hypothetical protein [Anaeromyxobacter sp.]